jgi:hypothetical protein
MISVPQKGTIRYDQAKKQKTTWLLVMIRGYCCQFIMLNNEYLSIVGALKNLFNLFEVSEVKK